jgi:hypothetical protein
MAGPEMTFVIPGEYCLRQITAEYIQYQQEIQLKHNTLLFFLLLLYIFSKIYILTEYLDDLAIIQIQKAF